MGSHFQFSGRIGKSEYWKYWFVLFGSNIILYLLLVALTSSQPISTTNWYTGETDWNPTGVLGLVFILAISLVLAIVGLSVSVRRWHDLGKSGIWVLISLIPIVGPLYAFYMQGFVTGVSGPNAYGVGGSASDDVSSVPAHSISSSQVGVPKEFLPIAGSVFSATAFGMLFGTTEFLQGVYYGVQFSELLLLTLVIGAFVAAFVAGSIAGMKLMRQVIRAQAIFLLDCAVVGIIALKALAYQVIGYSNFLNLLLTLVLCAGFSACVTARRMSSLETDKGNGYGGLLNDPLFWALVAFAVLPTWVGYAIQVDSVNILRLFDYNQAWVALLFGASAAAVSYLAWQGEASGAEQIDLQAAD